MKHLIIVIFCLPIFVSCGQVDNDILPPEELLDLYTQQNRFTDPREYLFLYDSLPKSYSGICALIKSQLIHPLEASEMQDILPEGRYIEDGDFLSVEEMLRGLMERDSNGLTTSRKPENRLVVACYHHGLLLASMLRSQNIPVRIRAGFARYFEEKSNVRFGHVICEIWNENEGRWIWVDPDREFIDMKRNQFELSFDAWQTLRKDKLPDVRYTAALMEDEQAILHILLLDHLFVMASEQLYWHTPSFLYTRYFSFENINENDLLVYDQIAILLSMPDTSLMELQNIYTDNSFLHPQEQGFEEFYEELTGELIENIGK